MSHTTTISGISIKDGTVLARAVENLKAKGINCDLVQNQTPRMYYRQQEAEVGKCDYVLKLPQAQYDVGFKWDATTGEYQPVYDEWANSVAGQVGAQCALPQTAEEKSLWGIGQLSQEYAKEAAIKAATEQGYMVEEASMDAEGNVNLVFAGM